MEDQTPRQNRPSPIEDLRDELGDEFLRVARSPPSSRAGTRLRHGGLAAIAALVLAPAAFAVEGALDDGGSDEPPVPAAPPVFSEASTCPSEFKAIIRDMGNDPSNLERYLEEYRQTPGYPVEGCPTAEEIQAYPVPPPADTTP